LGAGGEGREEGRAAVAAQGRQQTREADFAAAAAKAAAAGAVRAQAQPQEVLGISPQSKTKKRNSSIVMCWFGYCYTCLPQLPNGPHCMPY